MTDILENARQTAVEPRHSETLATKWIVALIALACVAFIGFQTARILNHRTELWNDDRTDTVNLTSSLIRHADLTVRTADALLIAAVFGLEHGLFNADNISVLHPWFAEEVNRSNQFNSFMIIDRYGRLVVGSIGTNRQLDLSDLEYFIYHKTHGSRELHIGAPVRGKVTGRWFIPVTRRFDRMDGSFGGVVVAALNPKFFLDAYGQIDVGKSGAIMLASLDRKLLVRRPFADADVGRDLPNFNFFETTATSGSLEVTSMFDGARRILSYGKSTNYPFLITVAKNVDETLAPWRHDTVQILFETASIVDLLILLGVIIWRVTRRLADKATTLHEANDRFDTAIKAMSHGLSLFDDDQRLVIVNARFLDMYQMTEEMVRPGTPFSELLRIHEARGDVVSLPEVRAGLLGRASLPPFRWLLKHGSVIAIRRTATPGGGWVAIHEDVTEQERAAEAMSAAKDAAEAASRAKSDFLAMMSHEIRTPMAGMMGMIHLLAETKLDQEQQELADTAQLSARNLLTVVNDILDFSKLEAGEVKPEAIDFKIEASIASVVALLGPTARAQGLTLATALAPELPRALKGDPSRVSQILLNLVGNAIKFTETGSVTIAASHRIMQDGRIELRIAVTDTGIGLPAATLNSLFNPFTQADTSVSRKYGGTGLGLAICKRLCETMDGTIGVESEPGRGSTFWFTVLCRPGSDVPDVAAPPLAVAVDACAVAILVADDNAIIRTLISKLLARHGYQADLACNGSEAVEAVQRKRYDVVLMDMQMPEMDGIAAARIIRGLSGPARDVPIIALTANATVGQREICLAAGMNSYLTKPIQPDALHEAIQRWGCVDAAQSDAFSLSNGVL